MVYRDSGMPDWSFCVFSFYSIFIALVAAHYSLQLAAQTWIRISLRSELHQIKLDFPGYNYTITLVQWVKTKKGKVNVVFIYVYKSIYFDYRLVLSAAKMVGLIFFLA